MLLKNTYNELIKILAKPRSYIGFIALTVLIGVILLAMKADGESFISFVTSSFEQTLSFNGLILMVKFKFSKTATNILYVHISKLFIYDRQKHTQNHKRPLKRIKINEKKVHM